MSWRPTVDMNDSAVSEWQAIVGIVGKVQGLRDLVVVDLDDRGKCNEVVFREEMVLGPLRRLGKGVRVRYFAGAEGREGRVLLDLP